MLGMPLSGRVFSGFCFENRPNLLCNMEAEIHELSSHSGIYVWVLRGAGGGGGGTCFTLSVAK